jgi:uncharacterized protein (TIGR02246 family)
MLPTRAGFLLASLLAALASGHLLLAPQSKLDPPKTSDSEAIEAVLKTQQAAWNRGDIRAFLLGYWDSPGLTFAGSDGIVRGYDGLAERYRAHYPDRQSMGELQFSGLEMRSLGPDSALVLGHWHLGRTIGDAGGVFSLVFHRFPTGWRIIHDHTSAERQKP